MKNSYCIILLILIIVTIITVVLLPKEIKMKINTIDNTLKIKMYNDEIINIEANLNYISIPNKDNTIKWYEFKDLDIQDSNLINTYNSLLSDIRICYQYATDDGTKYTHSNYLSKFKNKKEITKKEFKELINAYSTTECLDVFEKYNDLILSNNNQASKEIYSIIKPLLIFKNTVNNIENYKELLNTEYIKISLLSNITDYLKAKYIQSETN